MKARVKVRTRTWAWLAFLALALGGAAGAARVDAEEGSAAASSESAEASAHAQVAAADIARGAKAFAQYCAICHGTTGGADGPAGRSLIPPPRNFQVADFRYGGTDQAIFEVITHGAASKGGSPLMVSWGELIPEADRWALVKFVRSLKREPAAIE